MDNFDVVIVGSGINSLVCAAMLVRKRKRVLVLERSAVAGGCIRTEEITVPGFRHDLFSMSYPLFVMAPHYPVLKEQLEAGGLKFVSGGVPTAVVLPDGRSLVFTQSRDENVAAINALFRRGPRELGAFIGEAMPTQRSWLEREFRSDLVRALFAPWILHTGMGPDDAMGALMTKVIMFTLETAGIPFVAGGSSRIVDAFGKLIESNGSVIETNVDVTGVIVENGKAVGVETSDGRRVNAREAVVCNVTPTQLYQRLLPTASIPDNIAARARAFTYGRADMQIHVALSAPPEW